MTIGLGRTEKAVRSEHMILGTVIPYLRRQYSFGGSDHNGSLIAHHELLRSCLRYGVVDQAHLFLDRHPGTPEGHLMDAALSELQNEFGRHRVHAKDLAGLPTVSSDDEYVFVTKAPDLIYLSHARLVCPDLRYPICSLVHSTHFPGFLQSCIGMLLAAEPYDSLVVSSDAGKDVIVQGLRQATDFLEMQGYRRDKRSGTLNVVTLPLGIDETGLGILDRQQCRTILDIPSRSIVLLYVGRFSPDTKADIAPLLLVFNEMRKTNANLILLLAGHDKDHGGYADHIKRLSNELSLGQSVKTILNFPSTMKPIIYGAADIFVSPADNIQETFGLSVLEAMAAKLPVVASDWSGYREIVTHGDTGFLVPTMWNSVAAHQLSWVSLIPSMTSAADAFLAQRTIIDVHAYKEYLDVLVKSREMREQFGNAGRKRVVERFTWRYCVQAFKCLWEEQLNMMPPLKRSAGTQASMDLTKMYRHYATAELDLDTIIGASARLDLSKTNSEIQAFLELAGVPRALVTSSVSVLDRCQKPTPLRSFQTDRLLFDAAVILLKKGLCQIEQPPLLNGRCGRSNSVQSHRGIDFGADSSRYVSP